MHTVRPKWPPFLSISCVLCASTEFLISTVGRLRPHWRSYCSPMHTVRPHWRTVSERNVYSAHSVLTVQSAQCAHLQHKTPTLNTYYSTVHTKRSLTHTDLLITVQCPQCAHLQYSAHSAPKRTSQYSAHSALTYNTVRTLCSLTIQCAQYAQTHFTVQCAQCAHFQYSAHPVLTDNTVCTVRPNAHHSTVRSVPLLRPPFPLYFSTFCMVHSHCCRYFSTQSKCDHSLAVVSWSYPSKFQIDTLLSLLL
jgi:hypothetical protein